MKNLIILALLASASLFGKQTICLNMIVKNESHVIKRSLDSVKPLIDYWVIVDTGSTDGTQEIIREYLKEIPGKLYERPWKNFGHNRNEALSFAKGNCDYILFLDADDWYRYDKGYTFPELKEDAYFITLGSEQISYQRLLLIKDALPWRWEGVLHECIALDCDHSSGQLEGIFCVNGGDGASWKDPEKYRKYAAIFEEELQKDPTNGRNQLYLGHCYHGCGDLDKAYSAYEKRTQMGGFESEIYAALYQMALIVGKKHGPCEKTLEALQRAYHHSPERPETVYYLAKTYNLMREHAKAYSLIKEYLSKPHTKDPVLNLDWVTRWGLPFELSLSAYYTGKDQESLDLCDTLLTLKELPEEFRKQVIENRSWPEKRLRPVR